MRHTWHLKIIKIKGQHYESTSRDLRQVSIRNFSGNLCSWNESLLIFTMYWNKIEVNSRLEEIFCGQTAYTKVLELLRYELATIPADNVIEQAMKQARPISASFALVPNSYRNKLTKCCERNLIMCCSVVSHLYTKQSRVVGLWEDFHVPVT